MTDMVLQGRQDSALFSETKADKGIKSPTDGGYFITRARYTRTARRKFVIGFSDLVQEEIDSLLDFIETHGTFLAFEWDHPISTTQYSVRFEQIPVGKYIGRGGFHFWSMTDIVLVEV